MSKPSVMTLALLMGLSTTGCITGMYYEKQALEGDVEAVETLSTYNGEWWRGQRSLHDIMRSDSTPLEARQKAVELTTLDSEGLFALTWVACNPASPETLRLQALKRLEEKPDNKYLTKFLSSGELALYDGQWHYIKFNDETGGFLLKHLSNLDMLAQVVRMGGYKEEEEVFQEGLSGRTDKEVLQLLEKLIEKGSYRARDVAPCLKEEVSIAAYLVLCEDQDSLINKDVATKITSQTLLGKLVTNPKVNQILRGRLLTKLTAQEPVIALAKDETATPVLRRAAVLKIEDAATKSELAKTVFNLICDKYITIDELGEEIPNKNEYMMALIRAIQDEDFLCLAGFEFHSADDYRYKGLDDEVWALVSPEAWARNIKEKRFDHDLEILFALSKVTDLALFQSIVDDTSYSERVRNEAGNKLCNQEAIRKEVADLPKDVLAKEAAEVEARGKKVAEAANMFVINGLYLGMPVRDYYVLSYARNVGMDIHCYWDNEDKIARIDELTIKRGNVYAATGIEPNDMYGHLRFGSDLASFRSAKTTSEDAVWVFEQRMWGQHAVEDTWQASSTRAKNLYLRICIRGNEEGRIDLETIEGRPNKPDYSKKTTGNTDPAAASDALKLLGKAAQGAAEVEADIQEFQKAKEEADEALRQLEAMPEMPEMPSF